MPQPSPPGERAAKPATRSYDSDNHIVQQTLPADFSASLPIGIGATCTGSGNQQTKTYAWGADGRLATFATTTYYPGQTPSQTTSTEGAHWDGDDLLYVSYGGSIMMLYVEKLGVVMWSPSNPTTGASQMMVYDRDQSGTAVTNHWAGAFAKLNFDNIHATQGRCPGLRPNSGDPNNSCSPSGDGTAPTYGGPSDTAAADNNMTWGNTVPLDASRDDGYSDGTLSLQGVRAYDPNMNQWTTPDAYSGRVNDPMSQHPYMWNDNNPVQYADPSGYATVIEAHARDAFGPGSGFFGKAANLITSFLGLGHAQHVFITIRKDSGPAKPISFGPTGHTLREQGPGYEVGHHVNATAQIGTGSTAAAAVRGAAARINAASSPYLGVTSNSNSAAGGEAQTLGKNPGMLFPGLFVPGLDQPAGNPPSLSPTPQALPSHSGPPR